MKKTNIYTSSPASNRRKYASAPRTNLVSFLLFLAFSISALISAFKSSKVTQFGSRYPYIKHR